MRVAWLLLGVSFLVGCEDQAEVVVADQSVRPARIFQVVAEGDSITYEFVGRVEAAQTVDMSFEVAGPLAELPVLEGTTVPAGSLIAALDFRSLPAQEPKRHLSGAVR